MKDRFNTRLIHKILIYSFQKNSSFKTTFTKIISHHFCLEKNLIVKKFSSRSYEIKVVFFRVCKVSNCQFPPTFLVRVERMGKKRKFKK